MKIKREELLSQLLSVSPGLPKKVGQEQKPSFYITDGVVYALGDEIVCSSPCCLIDVNRVVPAQPLVELLKKLSEDEIEVESQLDNLLIKGKRKLAKIKIEVCDEDPLEGVDEVSNWVELPGDFSKAIEIVSPCVSRGEGVFILGCIHIHPEWVEGSDNYQLARYSVALGLADSVVVREEGIRQIVGCDMVEFAATESWLHFRNLAGLRISCRKYMEPYHDFSHLMEGTGDKIVFPKGLDKIIDKAEVFSRGDSDNNVRLELDSGKLVVVGKGEYGWYKEVRKIEYDGPPLSFMVATKMLLELSKKSGDCVVGDTYLRVTGDNFVFFSRTEV